MCVGGGEYNISARSGRDLVSISSCSTLTEIETLIRHLDHLRSFLKFKVFPKCPLVEANDTNNKERLSTHEATCRLDLRGTF